MVFEWIAGSCPLTCLKPGRIVWKLANASPGLKFIQIITFSSIQFFLLLLCFMFIKFKTENLIAKLQNSNQNFTFSWVSLIGFSTTWPEGATLLGWPKSIYYLKIYLYVGPFFSSVDQFVWKIEHGFFTMRDIGIARKANMLKEVPMRMFSSLTERINVLREPKLTPDVSTGFRPPCWSPSDGLQHGVSILNTIIFSDTFCRITRVRNIAHPRNFGTLFIYYSSTIFQFLDLIYWMVSDFIFHLRDN